MGRTGGAPWRAAGPQSTGSRPAALGYPVWPRSLRLRPHARLPRGVQLRRAFLALGHSSAASPGRTAHSRATDSARNVRVYRPEELVVHSRALDVL